MGRPEFLPRISGGGGPRVARWRGGGRQSADCVGGPSTTACGGGPPPLEVEGRIE
jgi:hypothetical protein